MTQPNADRRDQVNQNELKPGDMITLADGTGMIIGGMLPGEREDVELSELYPEVEEEDDDGDLIEDSSEEERQARAFQRVGRNGKPVPTKIRKKRGEKGTRVAATRVKQEALKGEAKHVPIVALEAAKHTPRVVPPPARKAEGEATKAAQEEVRGAASATTPEPQPAAAGESKEPEEKTGPQPPSRG